MPDDLPFIPHSDILRYEEILRICTLMANNGVKTFRVTGGEPLARRGCIDFIRELQAIPGVENVSLTTNAVLLAPYIETLASIGLRSLNISLDSVNPETYYMITGQNLFSRVWNTIEAAIESGIPTKINCVPPGGINDMELLSLVKLAEVYPIQVRFIEMMPTTVNGAFQGIPSEQILLILQNEYPDLEVDETKYGFGPAHYYKSKRFMGRVGMIDAISNHFCTSCNRLRLTSEGFLKLCLYHDDGLDLRLLLREGCSDEEINTAIISKVLDKPQRHHFDIKPNGKDGIKKMSRIGG